MVLHDLDSPDIIVADAVGSNSVFASEKVGTFDIELVYILALILDFSTLRNINTGHTPQHIADGAVLRLRETTDIVCDGVALFPDTVSLYRNFFEQGCPGFHIYRKRKRNAVKR